MSNRGAGKEKANIWMMQLGVQFPSRQPVYGSIGSIAYDEAGVRITGKTLQELGGVVTDTQRNSVDREKYSYMVF